MTGTLKAMSTTQSDAAEIDEELFFHLRSRIEDNLAGGMSADEAWEDARRRLGSYRQNVEQCQQVAIRRNSLMTLSTVVVALVLAGGSWLMADWRARSLIAQQPVAAIALSAAATADDLKGIVTDDQGQAVADAHILLILKTWPNNQYHQEAFDTKTDAKGEFKFEELLPRQGQFAVQAAVVHDGFALASAYHLFKAGKRDLKVLKPLKFKVEKAVALSFVLKDASGKPIADAKVAPASRKNARGEEHSVYFQSAEPVMVKTDAEGKVSLSCFGRGDDAGLFVVLPDGNTTEASTKIPASGDVVELVVKPR
jgi:uncharacterized GH25 family protein